MRIGVIGLGTAGITFISEIRRLKVPCEIFLFEKRGLSVFHPCSIPEAIEGKIKTEQLIEPFGTYQIKFIGEAKHVDPYKLSVSYEKNGTMDQIEFDFLFIATGGEIKIPYQSPKIFKATKYEDVLNIKNNIPYSKRIGIVGAGILGLELASALCNYPIEIEVFEAKDQILPDLLEKNLAEKLMQKISLKNIKFHFGKFINEPPDLDLLIFCTGFKPVSPMNFEIRVDDFMRVIDVSNQKPFERIFAAGDCISYDIKIPRVAPIAAEQARVSARNIKKILEGKEPDEKYELIIPPVLIKAFGYEIGKTARIHKPQNIQKLSVEMKVLPFDDRKLSIFTEVDNSGLIQEIQAFCELRSEVRHLLDISYISMKKKISLSEIRRFELSYQPEVCKFPDPITSFAEFITRRLNIL
ncbi:MAG: NAD(P)/FAD-dependent oxidoreductase [Candidatus Calescibacterium sp.]|nr:NAD(P)/FAD-dependent oxidoreductase [Candidatus Calescibacterium sp.]MCX7734175.1 NAD(P)/FAD-dependent oxidoreductase [bacterium]MDW8086564.1 FAD/NAD(P)-binding oxidoreductase [Candidatus Calescibacterium sp.]